MNKTQINYLANRLESALDNKIDKLSREDAELFNENCVPKVSDVKEFVTDDNAVDKFCNTYGDMTIKSVSLSNLVKPVFTDEFEKRNAQFRRANLNSYPGLHKMSYYSEDVVALCLGDVYSGFSGAGPKGRNSQYEFRTQDKLDEAMALVKKLDQIAEELIIGDSTKAQTLIKKFESLV